MKIRIRPILALIVAVLLPLTLSAQPVSSPWDFDQPFVLGRVEMPGGKPETTMTGDSLSAFLDEQPLGFRVSPAASADLDGTLARYLHTSPELAHALAWLRTARETAWRVSERPEFWNDRPQAASIQPTLRSAMAARIKEPLVVVTEGPGAICAVLHPAIMCGAGGSGAIRTLHSLVVIRDTEAVSLGKGISHDYLDLIVAHEIGHVIMHSLMGASMNRLNERKLPHAVGRPTDPGLALMEGWAEGFESILGRDRPDLSGKAAHLAGLPPLISGRQDPIRRERYIWVGQTAENRGRLLTGSEMMALEGVVAGLFYDLLTSRAIAAPFEKCCEVFALDRPTSFPEFGRAFLRRFPDDRRVFCRIVLENTRCAIMNRDVGGLYRSQYWAKKMYQSGKGSKEAFAAAERVYRSFAEKLIAEAVAGGDPFYNVGAPVWLQKWSRQVDLNSASREQFLDFGLAAPLVDRILAERVRRGYFTGNASRLVAELSEGLPGLDQPSSSSPTPPPFRD